MARLIAWLGAMTVALHVMGAARAADTIIVKASPYTVEKTIERLSSIVAEKGLTVFAQVDHGAGAAKAGLTLRPTKLLIFGNPKSGTLMMQGDQRVGLDLPLKALAWQDEAGKVWLGYWPLAAIKQRYGLAGKDGVFSAAGDALEKFTSAAVAPE